MIDYLLHDYIIAMQTTHNCDDSETQNHYEQNMQ